MIARTARQGDMISTAWYSDCGTYRYRLMRRWGSEALLGAVLLNPSTATETAEDATAARLVRRARAEGFGGLVLVNLFALRTTDPAALARASDPEGPENATAFVSLPATVLCGWGNAGAAQGRLVAPRLRAGRRLLCLGLTRLGAPRHPLYVAAARTMEDWHG